MLKWCIIGVVIAFVIAYTLLEILEHVGISSKIAHIVFLVVLFLLTVVVGYLTIPALIEETWKRIV